MFIPRVPPDVVGYVVGVDYTMEAAVSKSGIKTLEHMLHEVRECRPEVYDGLIMISAKTESWCQKNNRMLKHRFSNRHRHAARPASRGLRTLV